MITKYYIVNTKGSIEWVPSLEIAKSYVNNPLNKEWYGKKILSTIDEFVIVDNLVKLKSSINNIKTLSKNDHILLLKDQIEKYIQSKLDEYILQNDLISFQECISWIHSSIKSKQDSAKKLLVYRDILETLKLETYSVIEKETVSSFDPEKLNTIYLNFLIEINKL